MNKILMILAHPKMEDSIGNKIISESIVSLPNIEVRHLIELYPDFKIDVEAEQKALLNADKIIFQYPLYWYNVPAILKEWIDQVFQYGFAFGKDAYLLKDKKMVVSCTIGSGSELYPPEILDKIFYPFQGLANYCKLQYEQPIITFNVFDSNNINNTLLNDLKFHTKKLKKFIQDEN